MIFPHNLYSIEKPVKVIPANSVPNQDITIPNWLGALTVNEQHYYYFKWLDKNGLQKDPLLENDTKNYTFLKVHMIIPYFFQPLVVDDVGTIQNSNASPKTQSIDTINAYFALRISELEVQKGADSQAMKKVTGENYHEGKIAKRFGGSLFHGQGPDLCLTTAVNPLGYVATNIKDKINIRNLFFKFNHHYFFPLIFSNGMSCYYAFEDEREIGCLVQHFMREDDEILVGGFSPPYYDNILGVMIIKHIRLIYSTDLSEKRIGSCAR